jgi:4-hydroxybenzoate polyprenyltransferase
VYATSLNRLCVFTESGNKINPMIFLKLVRLPNLLIIACTQYLIRYTIIIPILAAYNLTTAVSEINFFLLVLSTVLIAAGGYVINDYHDRQIDMINKPSKVIIGKQISKKQSYLSFFQNIFLLWQINLISVALLWLYSSMLKKFFMVGNIVIALLAALSLLIIIFSEKTIWTNEVMEAKYLIFAYSLFAFIMTWIREVIKDLEDKEGDIAFNRKTLPVIAGDVFSKLFASFLILTVLFSLALIQFRQQQWQDSVSFGYVVIGIELPLVALLILLSQANKKKAYTVSSLLTKGIMLTGVLSMLVFYLRYK